MHKVDRGGQVTYHGPGQIVVYPIFDLNHHKKDLRYVGKRFHTYLRTYLPPHSYCAMPPPPCPRVFYNRWYVKGLEEVVIRVCARYGIEGNRDEKHTGVW